MLLNVSYWNNLNMQNSTWLLHFLVLYQKIYENFLIACLFITKLKEYGFDKYTVRSVYRFLEEIKC